MIQYEFGVLEWQGGYNQPGEWVFRKFGDQSGERLRGLSDEDHVNQLGQYGWSLVTIQFSNTEMFPQKRYFLQRAMNTGERDA